MNQQYNEIITESIVDIFEKVAFLFPMPVEEPGDVSPEECSQNICLGIKFTGHRNGDFILSLPKELTKEISANMLGVDEDDPDVEQKSIDAAKEILNIVCGNMLPKIYGEDPVFHLSAPYIAENMDENVSESGSDNFAKIQLDVDDSIVTVVFAVEQ